MNHRVVRFAGLFLLFVTGCQHGGWGSGVAGSGVIKSETRQVADYDEVRLSGATTMNISTGPLTPVTITTDDNLLPLIETKVENHRLIIRARQAINPSRDVVVKAQAPNIKAIDGSGATTVHIAGVNNESLSADFSGAGTLHAQGRTKNFTASISGAGNVHAEELEAQNVVADISGAGDMNVNAVKSLKASVSGAGTIRYKGQPTIDQSVSGAGSIRKL